MSGALYDQVERTICNVYRKNFPNLGKSKKSFDSMFNSKENSKYSFKEFIHSIRKKLFKIGGHIGKIELRSTTSWN